MGWLKDLLREEEDEGRHLSAYYVRRRRILILMSGAAISLVAVYLGEWFGAPDVFKIAAIFGTMAFPFFMALEYLRGRPKSTFDQYQVARELARLQSELRLMKSRTTSEASDSQRDDEWVEAMTERVAADSVEKVVRAVTSRFGLSTRIEVVDSSMEETRARLAAEMEALSRRGNLNLVIGIAVTLVGVGVLGWFLFQPEASASVDKGITNAIGYFLPRVGIALFLQVFAYFFLRLYKASLDEIKYFQNEITNVEMKRSSLILAHLMGESETLKQIILETSRTERNATLKQGETTVELQKYIHELDATNKAIAQLKEIADSLKNTATRQSS